LYLKVVDAITAQAAQGAMTTDDRTTYLVLKPCLRATKQASCAASFQALPAIYDVMNAMSFGIHRTEDAMDWLAPRSGQSCWMWWRTGDVAFRF
jgi:hypothetical protein